MRKFEKMYFAEFHLHNVPQITPYIFPHSAFRKVQIKSNNQLCVSLGLHLNLELISAHRLGSISPNRILPNPISPNPILPNLFLIGGPTTTTCFVVFD